MMLLMTPLPIEHFVQNPPNAYEYAQHATALPLLWFSLLALFFVVLVSSLKYDKIRQSSGQIRPKQYIINLKVCDYILFKTHF